MKIIYVNCGLRNEYVSDLRSNEHYLNWELVIILVRNKHKCHIYDFQLAKLVGTALVSQRSWVRIPYRPDFFSRL